jgi:hypothetical protein
MRYVIMEAISAIDDVVEVTPKHRGDDRRYFSETVRDDWFKSNVAAGSFVSADSILQPCCRDCSMPTLSVPTLGAGQIDPVDHDNTDRRE